MNKFEFIATEKITFIKKQEVEQGPFCFEIRQEYITSCESRRDVETIRTFDRVVDLVPSREINYKFVLSLIPSVSMSLMFHLKDNLHVEFKNKKLWVTSYNFNCSDLHNTKHVWDLECLGM